MGVVCPSAVNDLYTFLLYGMSNIASSLFSLANLSNSSIIVSICLCYKSTTSLLLLYLSII